MAKTNPGKAPHAAAARGFTLIELLIVVAIIGILAAIAYPSYSEQVRRGKRSDVETVMMQAAQYMQRNYAAKNIFDALTDDLKAAGYGYAPMGATGTNVTYAIEVAVNDKGRSFVLTATPWDAAKQAKDEGKDPKCGSLTLSDTGQKGSSKGSVADCWK
jgi:type IV pilus assembly protein PilE